MTTGLRPIALAFPRLPGTPVGIIVWDRPSAFPGSKSEILRKIKRVVTRRPYASLKDLCEQHQLHYATCDKSDSAQLKKTLEDWNADLVVTSGCAIVPMDALDSRPLGGINVHPSLLPQWKGANPLFWQLAADEPQVGVTVHELIEAVDGGDILGQAAIDRPDGLSRDQLTRRLEGDLGGPLLADCITKVQQTMTAQQSASGGPLRQPQTAGTTHYARTVKLEDLEDQVPLHAANPRVVWNLTRFLGHAPKDWLRISGWHRRVTWVASSYRYDDSLPHPENTDSNSPWHIKQSFWRIRLSHPQGEITLLPAKLARLFRLVS